MISGREIHQSQVNLHISPDPVLMRTHRFTPQPSISTINLEHTTRRICRAVRRAAVCAINHTHYTTSCDMCSARTRVNRATQIVSSPPVTPPNAAAALKRPPPPCDVTPPHIAGCCIARSAHRCERTQARPAERERTQATSRSTCCCAAGAA